jgi:hypothetical protein
VLLVIALIRTDVVTHLSMPAANTHALTMVDAAPYRGKATLSKHAHNACVQPRLVPTIISLVTSTPAVSEDTNKQTAELLRTRPNEPNRTGYDYNKRRRPSLNFSGPVGGRHGLTPHNQMWVTPWGPCEVSYCPQFTMGHLWYCGVVMSGEDAPT